MSFVLIISSLIFAASSYLSSAIAFFKSFCNLSNLLSLLFVFSLLLVLIFGFSSVSFLFNVLLKALLPKYLDTAPSEVTCIIDKDIKKEYEVEGAIYE